MIEFRHRRIGSSLVATLVGIGVWFLIRSYGAALNDARLIDGWLLLVASIYLTLFNLRKKVFTLPLGKVSHWTHAHIYVGIITGLLFVSHTRGGLPNGWLESGLWLIFMLLLISGIVGVVLSRRYPPRMEHEGELIIFERIPYFRRQLQEQAEKLIRDNEVDGQSNSISDFYQFRLKEFLSEPKNTLAHIFYFSRTARNIGDASRYVERYQNDEGRALISQLRDIIDAKNNLDRQRALQLALKGWLFVHIPLTYALAPLSIVHLLLVYAFSVEIP